MGRRAVAGRFEACVECGGSAGEDYFDQVDEAESGGGGEEGEAGQGRGEGEGGEEWQGRAGGGREGEEGQAVVGWNLLLCIRDHARQRRRDMREREGDRLACVVFVKRMRSRIREQ